MKVSILLATKNRPDWVQTAIASVLAQTDHNWELVVLDNGESIEQLIPADQRIQYHHATASGSADAFNQALRFATGDVVTPLADDDQIAPQTVATIRSRIGEYEWGYARTAYIRDGVTLFYLGDPWDLSRLRQFYYLGGAVFWRKSLSDRIGGFDPAFDLVGDYDLYLRFGEAATPIFLADEVLYLYHDHPLTDTNVHAQLQQERVAAIRSRSQ